MNSKVERLLTGAIVVLLLLAVGVVGFAHWVKARRAAQAETSVTRPQGPRGPESVAGPDRPVGPPPSGAPRPPQGARPSGAPIPSQPPPNGQQVVMAPPGGGPAQPAPEGAHLGPYEPWPASFPKLLPGFFLLEHDAPALEITKAQADQMLPLIEEMGTNWKIVHDVEIKIKQHLTLEQRAWITKVKHSVETSDTTGKIMAEMGDMKPGENASVSYMQKVCRARKPSPVPPALQKAADAEAKRVLDNSEYIQKPGEEWLTVFDESNAFYEIEHGQTELHITPEQAVMFLAILDQVVEPLRVVSINEAKMREILTPEQIAYVQDHMAELYKYRTGQVKPEGTEGLAFPGHSANTDAHKYHDPLFYETVRFLKSRVAQ